MKTIICRRESITAEEYQDLESLYQFLVSKREVGKNFKITKFDIETSEITEL